MAQFYRRTFLLGTTSLVLAAACGGNDNDPIASGAAGDVSVFGEGGTGEITFLIPVFPTGSRQDPTLVAGVPQRLPFIVADGIDNLREGVPASLDIRIEQAGELVAEATVAQRADGIITPYFALSIEFASPGEYSASLPGFPDVAAVSFTVVDADQVPIPQVGDTIEPTVTPTIFDDQGVTPICTRAIPCPFHDVSHADAATNGRAMVLLVATPGFCQTDICGPVVDLLMDAADGRDDLDVIHAEVYVNPSDFATGGFPELTPIVQAADLPFEPVLFVLDGNGVVIARIDTTFDRSELAEAIALA